MLRGKVSTQLQTEIAALTRYFNNVCTSTLKFDEFLHFWLPMCMYLILSTNLSLNMHAHCQIPPSQLGVTDGLLFSPSLSSLSSNETVFIV